MPAQDLLTYAIVGAAVVCGFVATGYALARREMPKPITVTSTMVLTAFAGAHMLGLIAR
ncbi:hypothetical protein [Bradyrhizobium sp.]|uniref:hypothetical protein n=1 Tax=Bradyrhizobium sp. TaxID=376 RepID=UPI0025BBC480|nr:hypothetical protein [Bradyrhizobium sp.]MCA3256289.1 hypothetical protein [Alphaproteobacteria bacterium]MCA3565984.1 hypothetical protein [Bradyrhizobium sp.]